MKAADPRIHKLARAIALRCIGFFDELLDEAEKQDALEDIYNCAREVLEREKK